MEMFVFEVRNLTDYEKYVFLNILKNNEEKKDLYKLLKEYFSKNKFKVNKTSYKTEAKEQRIAINKAFRLLKQSEEIGYEKIKGEFYEEK